MASRSTRRHVLKQGVAAIVAGGLSTGLFAAKPQEKLPPVRTITQGPKRHWFGYYDKLEFDPTSRYVLGMEVDFEHRAPRPEDRIGVGMVDLQAGDAWIPLGTTTAWCWQQGCMLQWLPGSKETVVWNDREGGEYVCRILNVRTKELRTIPHPIYALSPDGKTAIATDFRRLGHCRPGYGYNGISDPNEKIALPKDTGIFRIDLATGRQELILAIADVAKFGPQLPSMQGSGKHWFNHLLFNPEGTRFVFLHRWQTGPEKRETRMITANLDGSDLHVLDANGITSHFIWRDPEHILAFSRQPVHGNRFYLFDDKGRDIEPVAPKKMQQDGHCTYLPGGEWILNDSYPDKQRLQHPYLYHVKTERVVPLGHFLSPAEYTGEWRCDTHPRFSPDGRKVVIDSPHAGGRQLHLIDISEIVG
ncbi:MAG: hypothetical protein U0903_11325 [Planctomycetales bacterium]